MTVAELWLLVIVMVPTIAVSVACVMIIDRVGPLDGDSKYRVSAEKDGYMFTAVDGKLGNFKAFKLAEIAVEVMITTINRLI